MSELDGRVAVVQAEYQKAIEAGQMDSLHTKHILDNPGVAFALFDSHQKDGEGSGIQGSGKDRPTAHAFYKSLEFDEYAFHYRRKP